MPYLRILSFVVSFVATLSGCKKDISTQECQKLKDGMVLNNTEEVKTVITQFINHLPSKTHTQQNVENLAASISANCAISAQVLCFGCIKTLPEQSEIRLSFMSSGTSIQKTIDISYTPDNEIRFVHMHD
jgi:hypothetical protein